MSSSLRDTQFQGFAHAIFEELYHEDVIDTRTYLHYREEIEQIIARRAYDLVEHSVGYSLEYLDECGKEISGSMNSRIMPSIPDMIELPKEEKK